MSVQPQILERARSQRVCVIGGGVVGVVAGIGFREFGHSVVFRDIDPERLEYLRENGFLAFGSPKKALADAEVSVICVPTPTRDGEQDLSAVFSAIEDVAANVSTEHHLLLLKSTVLPGTTRTKIWPRLRKAALAQANRSSFGVVCNPEFLRHQFAVEEFLNPPAIVIGSLDKESSRNALRLYATLDCPKFVVSLEAAELIKYAANAFNALKISFFNEMWLAAQRLDVDHNLVSTIVPKVAVGLRHPDSWGVQGGRPFGGACLPKDLEAFVNFLRNELDIEPKILAEVLELNFEMAQLSC